MEKTIEVKPLYGGWRKVNKEQAKDFVTFLLQHCMASDLVNYINNNKIKGITVKELLEEV